MVVGGDFTGMANSAKIAASVSVESVDTTPKALVVWLMTVSDLQNIHSHLLKFD